MTTLRGKAPLNATRSPKVSVDPYAYQRVRVESGGFCGKTQFTVVAELSPWCAKDLIRDLRRALRKIRDEECAKLQQAVADAEGPLS